MCAMICYSVLHLLFVLLCRFAEGVQWTRNLNGKPGEGYYIEVLIGTPPQKFNVLVDTGSSNFAIAGGLNTDVDTYFASQNSSTYLSKHRKVSVVYTQGYWEGELGNDVVMFPSLNAPTVRCDISEIHKSHNFYMNGSQWQGILGLAYPVISRPDKTVLSWLEALEHHRNKSSSFSLELCGPDEYENKHTGIFSMLDEEENKNVAYASPLLKEWFYELLITRISVGGKNVDLPCSTFNTDKTILDSGTTSLRLPIKVFHLVVEMMNSTVVNQNVFIPDDFWLLQKMVCWKEALNWTILPNISLSLMQTDHSYFTIELPGQSYFRKVQDSSETVNSYCFKFAIEPSTTGTVLGVIVMEGLKVVFNRNSKAISFSTSNCGPPAQLFGPFSTNKDLRSCSSPLPAPKVSALTVAGFVVAAMLGVFGFAVGYFVCQYLIEKYIIQRQSQQTQRCRGTALLSED